MKKKSLIIGIIAVVLIIIGVGLFSRPTSLGNMNNKFGDPTTSASNITFWGEAGERIKFSFRSNVDAGKLDILLYDSEGNLVYELDKARELETFYTFSKADTYKLVAQYSDFVGDYKITVYEAD